NDGYVKDDNLIVANYDWRLPPGPTDGTLNGVDAASIASGKFRFGVDYLGYWLKQAIQNWQTDYPGLAMPGVDVIAHSTGGLITRTYIQSAAYHGQYGVDAKGNPLYLPKINNFIMVGVPTQGAPAPWLALNDQWGANYVYHYVFASIFNNAYQK